LKKNTKSNVPNDLLDKLDQIDNEFFSNLKPCDSKSGYCTLENLMSSRITYMSLRGFTKISVYKTQLFAKKLLDLGCFISFSGIITFKKSSDLRDVVKYVPIEKMLIETDSPYLSPDPFRGKSNEPANVKIVAENVALIKDISFENVANITTKNFKNFFFN